MPISAFQRIVDITIGHEGEQLSVDPADRGNWSGGGVGRGELIGSRFGISAAAFPDIDIRDLTLSEAEALYAAHFWAPLRCEALPAPIALLVFDGAVHSGPMRSAVWLQAALGLRCDGMIGPISQAAVARACGTLTASRGLRGELLARRAAFLQTTPVGAADGLGFARRLFALPFQSIELESF